MFEANSIAAAVLLMVSAVGSFAIAEKLKLTRCKRLILFVSFLAAAYCFAAGIQLLSEWRDPSASTEFSVTAHRLAAHRRGLSILVALRYWPHVLIGVSGAVGFASLSGLLALRTKKRQS